jgi:hypothetical protein
LVDSQIFMMMMMGIRRVVGKEEPSNVGKWYG